MTPEQAFNHAYQSVPRRRNGEFDQKALIDLIAENLGLDLGEAKRRAAARIFERRTRMGTTEPAGQLTFEGMAAYAYEPDRLILGKNGTVIEQSQALAEHKFAEAARASVNAANTRRKADRKESEARSFVMWTVEQISRGSLTEAQATFGRFIRDAKVWRPEDVEQESPDWDEE